MHVIVRLLNGFKKPLTYKIPLSWELTPHVKDIIRVPLKHRTELAYITALIEDTTQEKTPFIIKEAFEKNPLPADSYYAPFINRISYYYCVDEFVFYQRLSQYLEEQSKEQEPTMALMQSGYDDSKNVVVLTPAQHKALADIKKFLTRLDSTISPEPIVLHGVTGSGKTEIYKALIKEYISKGQRVLFLLPEVSLAIRFTHIFKSYFAGTADVFGFHSATPKTERRRLWKHLYNDRPTLIIGVHLPILLPIPRLGCIIIDEEHDIGYQEKKNPRIHIKEAALLRAHIANIPIILGSATPSMNTLYHVEHKGWKIVSLTERYKGSFPEIRTVLLDKKNKSHFWISTELYNEITLTLERKEQALIFLNRRGYSFFVQCFGCMYIFTCMQCSVSLTLHETGELQCHYCGYKKRLPSACPACKEPERQFLKKGIGTQQLVMLLQKLFPTARIGRADLDSTSQKKKWQQVIQDMQTGALDILIGTQTITKGYHFPQVTLVGIVWADSNIHIPFYMAAETTLTQLIQVAGRSGRERSNGKVILQALADHQIFSFINEKEYLNFYAYEKAYRKELCYPPYIRFAEIELRHSNESVVLQEAVYCADLIQNSFNEHNDISILGPSQPPVHKIQNIYLQKIYLKSSSINTLIKAYHIISRLSLESSHFFTPNPLS